MSKKIVFAHPSIAQLGADVAWQINADVGTISWKPFPDGRPNLFIEEAEKIKNRDVIFIANLTNPATDFEQLAVIYALPRHFVRSLRVIIPFFPVGTMERVNTYGEIATAESLARMFSATPMTQSGPVIFTIVDIHALQAQFYFSDQILPELVSAVPQLLKRLWTADGPRDHFNTAIAFPDDGAKKRFGNMFPDYPHIICNKVRQADGSKVVTIKEGDPAKMFVVIVDDLIQTGGTLIECRNTLIQGGARGVSAFASHGIFANNSIEKFTPDLFDHVWITDSCPETAAKAAGRAHFEVLSLAPELAKLV